MFYLISIFIAAFLLFQVQPLIAKVILPFFGGGAAVWTACLLFFQGALFIGYLYAHVLTRFVHAKQQIIIHFIFVLLSLLLLPLDSVIDITEEGLTTPLQTISQLLLTSVGIPYILLASTGPLLQRWLTYQGNNLPYKMYALSNTASLLALISYPFIVEPLLGVKLQTDYWSVGYVVYAIVISALMFNLYRSPINTNVVIEEGSENRPSFIPSTLTNLTQVSLWLILSAIGVIFLISTTNAMTQNIPPVPFLWILPLCLYLLSFILCFHSPKAYVRWYWFALFSISACAATLLFFIGSQFTIVSQLVLYAFILMSACMLCHGELVRLKPNSERLTLFYLVIALGGFLGSAFVNFIAPIIFTLFLEFLVAIWCLFLCFSLCITWENKAYKQAIAPSNNKNTLMAYISLGLMVVLIYFYSYLNAQVTYNAIESTRNFYGLLSVKDVDVNGVKERRLIDGTTSHGTQLLAAEKAHIPMSYYRENTGVALALRHLYQKPDISVGLIGLGAGTLAAYADADDSYYFYELNPNVERMAKAHFSYLKNTPAYIDVVLGDGRVSLVRELEEFGSNNYEVLVLDAFTGDSIPMHLLTVEAFELYWQHLAKDGVLAIHVSNSHLDLKPLIRAMAINDGKQALYFATKATKQDVNDAHWIILTNNESFSNHYKVKALLTPWPNQDIAETLWTDDYSNLLSVLK